MTTEEKIRKAAMEFASNKYGENIRNEFPYLSLGDFTAGANFGRKLGIEEATRWLDPATELPGRGIEVLVKAERIIRGETRRVIEISWRINDFYHSETHNPFACEGHSEYGVTTRVIGWRPLMEGEL